MTIAGSPFRWARIGDDFGRTALVSSAGVPLLALDSYCYVRPLNDDRLLLWRTVRNDPPSGGSALVTLSFFILPLRDAVPFESLAVALAALGRQPVGFAIQAEPQSQQTVPAGLPSGVHALQWPAPFHEISELLVLASPEVNALALWIIEPHHSKLTVFPQDWFNQSNVDFGYQWVTRVARHPKSGRIVGDGIRIDPFVLDESNRNLAAA